MTETEKATIIGLIEDLKYGEIIIKKENGVIVIVKKTVSLKLSDFIKN